MRLASFFCDFRQKQEEKNKYKKNEITVELCYYKMEC